MLDPSVLFAGYKVPHPLENDIEIKIQTDERSNPADALKRACHLLITQVVEVKRQFTEQARNVEMGIGGAEPAPGGYDPYGDGQASNVYDF